MLLLSSPTVHAPTSLSDTEMHTSTDGVSSNFNLCSEQWDQAFHWESLFIPDWKVLYSTFVRGAWFDRFTKKVQVPPDPSVIRTYSMSRVSRRHWRKAEADTQGRSSFTWLCLLQQLSLDSKFGMKSGTIETIIPVSLRMVYVYHYYYYFTFCAR